MSQILKVKQIGLSKLNNSEYTNLMNRVNQLISANGGISALGVSEGLYEPFVANIEKMTDIVSKTNATGETQQMNEVDESRDRVIKYLFSVIRSSRMSPIEDIRAAAKALFLIIKPYNGMHRLPNQQETQQVNGLLLDLGKDANSVHVKTMSLDTTVAELNRLNKLYNDLTVARAAELLDNALDAGKKVRLEMDVQYDDIVQVAYANSIINPTDKTASFIKALNALIDELNALYNQRLALLRAAAKAKKDNGDQKPDDSSLTAIDEAVLPEAEGDEV